MIKFITVIIITSEKSHVTGSTLRSHKIAQYLLWYCKWDINEQTWVQVHWYLYLSTISPALPSTCKVFKYFLLKVTCTCTCTESLSQVLKVLKVLNLSTSSVLKYHSTYLRKYLSTSWTGCTVLVLIIRTYVLVMYLSTLKSTWTHVC